MSGPAQNLSVTAVTELQLRLRTHWDKALSRHQGVPPYTGYGRGTERRIVRDVLRKHGWNPSSQDIVDVLHHLQAENLHCLHG